MLIKSLPVGPIGTNCYIVSDPETKQAAVIDPGDEGERIMELVQANGLTVVAIVNTHGHWDHVGGNAVIKEMTGAPLMIHQLDADFLTDGKLNLSGMMGPKEVSPAADRLLTEGDEIQVGSLTFRVLHTPGHTPGGISLAGEGVAFVGDTLFARSIGRTDFPGGSFKTIIQSIKEKLLPLGDQVVAYPGHGPRTEIGQERKANPFLAE